MKTEWVEKAARAFEGERDRLIQTQAQGERMDVRVCHRAALSAVEADIRADERARWKAEGKVLVPRDPDAAMQKALTDLVSIMHGDQHSRDTAAWEAVKGYRAMIQAVAEGG